MRPCEVAIIWVDIVDTVCVALLHYVVWLVFLNVGLGSESPMLLGSGHLQCIVPS